MIHLYKSFHLLCRTIIIALIVSSMWMFGLPTFSASATPTLLVTSNAFEAKDPTRNDSDIAKASKQRIEAVDDCSKYLKKGNKDTTAQLDKPLDKTGSKQLVGALKVSDNPEPTVAEVDFKRCLEEKGVAPKM